MTKLLPSFVTHNIGLKILSLVLATGLWLALARDPIAEVAVEVPIVFRNVPDNLIVSYEKIPQAQILLRGPERAVRLLQPSDVHAEVDAVGGQLGEWTFPWNAIRVHKPHDLQVANVAPDKFQITFVTGGRSIRTSPAIH
jgi:hypothetical protein